ncbi:hypothetical protein D5S17_17660 [Pseudonocardiaceae bacterium YIM PH 21723]|nr:hypothetical protein D5S17_17660 [Pseudonocardiaceae bacterium YIM PH 21723]
MNTVEFRRVSLNAPGNPEAIDILVDGRLLADIIRDHELAYAVAAGEEKLAGSYGGLADISLIRDHGESPLLGCVCGDWGCWPLFATIDTDERTVRWHSFRNGRRDWPLDGVGPFVFDRDEYLAAKQKHAQCGRDI